MSTIDPKSATSASPPRSQYTWLPGKLTRQLRRLTPYDLLVAGIMAVVVVYLNRSLGMMGLLIGLGLTWLMLDQLDHVRVYDLVFIKLPLALWTRYVRKGYYWKNGWHRSAIYHAIKDLPGTDIGLTYSSKNKGRVSVRIEGEGSVISSLTIDGQRAMHERIAEAIKRIVSVRGQQVTFSVVYQRRLEDPDAQRQFDEQSLTPGTILPRLLVPGYVSPDPETAERDKFDRENSQYRQELAEAFQVEGLTDITMAAIVTMEPKGVSGGSEPIFVDEVDRQPIIEAAKRAIEQLGGAGILGLHTLSATEMSLAFIEAWHHNPEAFRQRYHKGEIGPLDHLPHTSISARAGVVSFDGTSHHALLRLVGNPEAASPLLLQQLFAAPSRLLTVSLVSRAMRTTADYLAYGFMIEIIDGIRELAGGGRVRPKAKRRDAIRRDREQKAADNPIMQIYDIWIVVTHHDLALLERVVKDTLNFYDTCGLRVERVSALEPIQYDLTWRALSGMI